jgi:large subunit ribosomal protein L10
MNRDEKAAVIEEVADQIRSAEAIFAVDYRGLSVQDAANLRTRLVEAGATFRVVKNRLTILSADAAGAESLKELLEGPTAFTFVTEGGDAALAAKALAQYRRETETLAFKGGQMGGEVLSIEQIESISRLPSRDTLNGQLVGVLASPLTTLVRGLAGMISGLASQLQQMADQGLVTGEAPAAAPETAESAEAPAAEAAESAEAPAADAAESAEPDAQSAEAEPAAEAEAPPEEAPAEPDEPEPEPQGDPVAEAAEKTSEESDTPSEGETE